MRRAVLLLAIVMAWTGGRARAADRPPPGVRDRFVATRDAQALLAALPAGGPGATPWRDLALMATGQAPGPSQPDAEGLAALPSVVLALRELALDDATRAARKADHDGGAAAAWVHALVLLRHGDDVGAVSRLLAPPLFSWDRDAFSVSLVSMALAADDRQMLAAGARAGLERAAARLRIPAVVAMAQAASAVDPASAPQTLILAVRALRRARRYDTARQLLSLATRRGTCGTRASSRWRRR